MNSEINVTFVLGGLVGGGAERVASTLINYWVQQNYKVKLITRLEPEHDKYTIPEAVERICIGDGGPSSNKLIALFKNIPLVWRLRKAIRKANTPVVISFLTKANIQTIIASIGLKKRIIISERNDTTREYHPWPWSLLRWICYRFADVVTANSEISVGDMIRYVPQNKLRFLDNPVDIPVEKAVPKHSQVIINVSRLEPQKRQELLLEAFSDIKPDIASTWKIHLLGEGSEWKNLVKRSRELRINEKVYFQGFVNNPYHYYKEAAIFVLTSTYEGTPNALLEALAHGLPCIVSDSLPGAMKYVDDGKNGFYFNSGDAADLTEKLTTLMEIPDMRAQFGNHSVMKVENLSIEKISDQWINIFKLNNK